jgi:hypothetical protein
MTANGAAIGFATIGRAGRGAVQVEFRDSGGTQSAVDTSFSIMASCAT